MRKLYEETMKQYVKLLLMCILSVIAVEIFFGIYRVIAGTYSGADFLSFFGKKCITPSIINFGVLLFTKWFLENPDIKVERKPYATFISMAVVVLVVTVFHSDYMALLGAFMLPVMVASIYGRREYIRLSVEVGALGIVIAFCVKLFKDKNDFQDISYYAMHLYIALILLFISSFVARLIGSFAKSNNEMAKENDVKQQNLADRVKVDMMTGLINHSAFYDELDKQIRESDRNNTPLSIAVVDIDNFKSVNDTYGHANGDKVLITLADIMKEVCKDHIVCRYGGEEFSVIFINTKKKEAVAKMEEILEKFRNTQFDWCNHPITFSCGVCQHYDIRVTAEDFFMQADKYLYRAKRGGKNQVVSE